MVGDTQTEAGEPVVTVSAGKPLTCRQLKNLCLCDQGEELRLSVTRSLLQALSSQGLNERQENGLAGDRVRSCASWLLHGRRHRGAQDKRGLWPQQKGDPAGGHLLGLLSPRAVKVPRAFT